MVEGRGTVVGASLALEITQYLLGVGRSDVTDIIVNLVGAWPVSASSRWRAAGSSAGRWGP